MQKVFIPFFILCSLLVPAKAAEGARNFVKNIVTESLSIVNGSGTDEEKCQKLSKCINKYLDIPKLSNAVFSGYKKLNKDYKEKAHNYLTKYLLNFYASKDKLSAMFGARLVSDPVVEQKNNDFAVSTKFTKEGDTTSGAEIVWVVTKDRATNEDKIFYVEIAGINQVITLRSEMKASIADMSLESYLDEKIGSAQ